MDYKDLDMTTNMTDEEREEKHQEFLRTVDRILKKYTEQISMNEK